MQCILLVGTDEMLLETRAAILKKTNSEVITSDSASALAIQEDRECDLVMLCHSLREDTSISLAEAIRERWPKTHILLVQSCQDWRQAEVTPAVDATSSPEPARLIETITELLRQPVASNAGYVDVRGGIARGGPFAS